MSKTVFILGAGASTGWGGWGAPVMSNFLDKAQDLLVYNKIGEYKEDFELVFRAISCLQSIHSKTNISIHNIENVFALFEMGKLLKKIPNFPNNKINKLIRSIKKVIYFTLNETTKLKVNKNNKLPPESPTYAQFMDIVIDSIKENKTELAIITFNYDLSLDYVMYRKGFIIDYCIENKERESNMNFYKLHGSLNWFEKEGNSQEIIPVYFDDYLAKYHNSRELFPYKANQDFRLGVLNILTETDFIVSSDIKVKDTPFIIPPSLNKIRYHSNLSKVWRKASKELSEADKIFIIGYSLPETDIFFKYLFALGSVGKVLLKGFYVIDIDEKVDERFKKFLGPGIDEKYVFLPGSFHYNLENIKKNII